MITIEGFAPVTINHGPSVTHYQGATYRSDRAYTDASGAVWRHRGTVDGASLWGRDSEPDVAWTITAVVDRFGPLTENETA